MRASLRETKAVVLSYTDMLAATVGLGLMVVIAVVSARAIRRRISHQAWYFIHLYAYLALALSFAHQFATGADFATHPFNRAAWIALYAGVGLLLVVYRVGKPVRDALRHRLRVAQVVRENPDAVSVYLTRPSPRDAGRRVRPVLLVAIPDPRRLVAGPPLLAVGGAKRPVAAGDGQEPRRSQSRHAPGATWHPGPGRGPLRRFHLPAPPAAQSAADRWGRRHHARCGRCSSPCPGRGREITMLYRARNDQEVMFRHELDRIAKARQARVVYLVGSRAEHPEYLTARHLRRPGTRHHRS